MSLVRPAIDALVIAVILVSTAMKQMSTSKPIKFAAASLSMLALVGSASQTMAQSGASGRSPSTFPTSVENPSWRSPERGGAGPSGNPSGSDSSGYVADGDASIKPIYWNKSEFLIPFNVGSQGQLPDSVELEVSVDAGRNWTVVEKQKLASRQFTFRSNGDGLYWFRIKTMDKEGRSLETSAQPMAIVIDTSRPQIDLVVDTDSQARMIADFRIADSNLSNTDMRLEYQTELDSSWVPVQMQTQFGRNTMEVVGKSSWDVPIRARQMVVRLIVKDQAGNESEVTRLPTLLRTANASNGLKLTSGGSIFSGLFPGSAEPENPAAGPTLSSNMPSSVPNMLPGREQRPQQELLPTPPAVNRAQPQYQTSTPAVQAPPMASANSQSVLTLDPAPHDPLNTMQRYNFHKIDETRLEIGNPAGSAPVGNQPPSNVSISNQPLLNNQVAPNQQPMPARTPEAFNCSSKAFSLDYNVEVDPGNQVSDVELWATVDGGRNWAMWGSDPDKASPFDVKVQTDGLFGFRMVVVGTNGLANHRPLPGDDADAWIQVDTKLPVARIQSAQYGKGNEGGALVIEYTAQDEFLADRPIAFAYSTSPDGPWTLIQAEIPNTGRYLWAGNANMPRRVYLKIEAYDKAGNVYVDRMELPVDLEGLAPRGRIQGFRAIPQ